MKRNYDNYFIEFRRNLGYRRGMYTWFVSRPNYNCKGRISSYSVWCYTTDRASEYDFLNSEDVTKADIIRYIKSHSDTLFYNSPDIY